MITPNYPDKHDSRMYAAFMMEGLRDHGDYTALLDHWDRGCYELVDAMVGYVDFMVDTVTDAMGAMGEDDMPGMLEYEVCSGFGLWYAKQIMDNAYSPEPSKAACHEQIKELVFSFFTGNPDLRNTVRYTVAIYGENHEAST